MHAVPHRHPHTHTGTLVGWRKRIAVLVSVAIVLMMMTALELFSVSRHALGWNQNPIVNEARETTESTTSSTSTSKIHRDSPWEEQRRRQQELQQQRQTNHYANEASFSNTATTIPSQTAFLLPATAGSSPLRPTTTSTTDTRTLVVITGSLRGGERAWQSLYDNLLDVNDQTDLALITEDAIPGYYQNSSLFSRAKYVWYVPKYEDWADAMDLVHQSATWRDPLFRLYTGGENTMLGGIKGPFHETVRASGAIVFMFRYFLSQRLQELDLITQYDRFVITRSDHYYLCPQDLRTLSNRYIWVPEGEDYKGICDRHFICGRQHILRALDILPPLLSDPDKYYKQLTHFRYNSERFLKHRWAQEGLLLHVRRYPRNIFTCATTHDSSRWSTVSEEPVEQGVHIKYLKEYQSAVETCRPRAQQLQTPQLAHS